MNSLPTQAAAALEVADKSAIAVELNPLEDEFHHVFLDAVIKNNEPISSMNWLRQMVRSWKHCGRGSIMRLNWATWKTLFLPHVEVIRRNTI